jgi:hypothetical protein
MNGIERMRRFEALKSMPCIACQKGRLIVQCGETEIHHLNAFGHAGMKRRGDEFTVPLGVYHHRGIPLAGFTTYRMEETFGPSLARNSRRFREVYGSDDELLETINERLAAVA